jgi:alpha-aminoadipic semialdehyde synthase
MFNPSRLWRRGRLPSLRWNKEGEESSLLSLCTRETSCRRLSSSVQAPLTIGILRESYNKWERRAPLCPDHVKQFLQKHPSNQVLVQPSSNRIFSNQEYQQAGAILLEDLGQADLFLGVKRPHSLDTLTPHKTYLFFSHVIKGQPENMPLLQNVLDKQIELVDYECIVQGGTDATDPCKDRKQKRLVTFGKYAGMAGMMDVFQVLGRRLLLKSWSTPFLNCPSAISHYNLQEVKRSVGILGERLEADGLPPDLEPLIFSMTGKGGNVHSGVREIFDILPHETVSVEDLPQVLQQSGPQHKVYGVDLGVADLYQRTDAVNGLPFDREHFRENPTLYSSTFASKVAPYTHVLVNGIYWNPFFPRLLTKDGMRALYEEGNERYAVENRMLVQVFFCRVLL